MASCAGAEKADTASDFFKRFVAAGRLARVGESGSGSRRRPGERPSASSARSARPAKSNAFFDMSLEIRLSGMFN